MVLSHYENNIFSATYRKVAEDLKVGGTENFLMRK
jgi:hypothetical protein